MPGGRGTAVGGTVYFRGFRFETATGRLWRDDDHEVSLRPKTASVLTVLVSHAGDTVSKQQLLETVWPDGFVGDAVLTVSVTELRQALADDPKSPGYIATAHRRGYRFVAPVSWSPGGGDETSRRGAPFVGRETELALLEDWWERAREGVRQVGFVAAQAGVGKTALVDVFAERVGGRHDILVGRGQCVEQFGEGEAYLPLLDAFGGLGRGVDGRRVRDVLRTVAPTWLLQLSGVVEPADLDALRAGAVGMSAERMLREVGVALEVLAAERPVVLILEDLHHSDRSTTEVLAYLAQRRDPARLLIVGTYRPAEVASRSHPLRQVVRDLRAHNRCRFLPLELLTRPAVGAYLTQRLEARRPADALVDDVHQRTDGNALFVTTVVDYLLDRGLLTEVAGEVRGCEPLDRLGIPDSLGQFIERQVDELAAGDGELLTVAAAVGADFTAEAVLAGAQEARPDLRVDEVEERFSGLARDTGLLGEEDLVEWPDGTVTAQYRFRHALYQEVLYGHLSPARRVAVHRRIGERLAAGFGPRAGEIAAELAVHFERGRDYEQAIRSLARAAETALQRLAHREALDYADRGLQLLERTGSIAGRPAVELRLRMMKVVALVTLEGYGAPAVDVAYQQARAVCAEIDDPTLLGPVLYGLRSYASARGRMDDADELVAELHRLAQRHPDPVLEMQAHHAAGADDGFAGRQASALAHFERCLELYDPATHRQLALVYGEDPGVASHHYSAFVNWFLGYPDRARRHATAACRLARDLGYPNDIVLATTRAAFVQIMCGDVDRAEDLNGALLEMCQQHDLARWWAYWKVVDGWALGRRDEPAKAVAQMRDGLAGLSAAGAMLGAPFFAALLAELLADLGDTAAAHETTAAALDATSRTGHHWYDAELIRLQGELRLRTDGGAGVETAFENAIAVARQQQARSFELRAVTSLARLWMSRGDGDRAREVLAETYRWFGEGHDTHDLRAAAALMADLG